MKTRHIELVIHDSGPHKPGDVASAPVREILERVREMVVVAERAICLGRQSVAVPTRWVEETLILVEPFANPTRKAFEDMDRWNHHRAYIYELRATYGGLPDLLAEADAFFVQAGSSDAFRNLDTSAEEEFETVEACTLAAIRLNDSPAQAALVFGDDDPIGSSAVKVIRLPVVAEVGIGGLGGQVHEDAKQLERVVGQAVRSRMETILLEPEVVIGVLEHLSEHAFTRCQEGDLEKQILDLEEGIIIDEDQIEHDIGVLRDGAKMLRCLVNSPENTVEYGLDLVELTQWLSTVDALRTPQEERGSGRE